jgi:Cytochrome c
MAFFVAGERQESESTMNRRFRQLFAICTMSAFAFVISGAAIAGSDEQAGNDVKLVTISDLDIGKQAQQTLAEGRQVFRFDTFGDQAFWGDTIKLHQAIEGARFGGVGPGVSPKAALAIGLKVDVDALPSDFIANLKNGKVNLDDPAATLALLKLNAVIGVTGVFASSGNLSSIGIQCALCHSTVDNSLAPGIGNRLDGWANRDLNVGAIINLAPDLSTVASLLGVSEPTVRKVLLGWGSGKFDAELLLDGKGFRPDGKTAATLIPPAFGLTGVNLHTWTGWGSVTHWNAFVANLEMHGKGTFFDPRLNDAGQFPVAARAGFGNVRNDPDLISSKLPALHFYQLAIAAPKPPEGSFDENAALRGKQVFENNAHCAACHVPPTYTEPGWNMHSAQEIGIDDFQANRSPDKKYRTTPLKGLWTHQKGGFYHDGRFQTLRDVVNHYDAHFGLNLNEQEKDDLIAYLKSL